MTNPTACVPAGWYPDPTGLPQLRWWDNDTWTERTTSLQEPIVSHETIVIKPPTAWAEPADPTTTEAPTERAEADELIVYEKRESTTTLPPPSEETNDPAGSVPTPTPSVEHSEDRSRPTAPKVRAAQSDWRLLSEAVHDATLPLAPTVISVTADDIPPLLIDVAERAYWWDLSLDNFPASSAGIQLTVGYPGEIPTPLRAGQPIEPLLWAVGTASFAGAAAPWLEPAGRYKLRRWPNLTSMTHTSDQLRLTSMLSHAHLTAVELSAVAESTLEESQTLINTYSLMGLLRFVHDSAASSAPPAMRAPVPEHNSAPSLFSRLRSRLGL